jgi:hypothetical protein
MRRYQPSRSSAGRAFQYDPDKLGWIGNLTRETHVEFMWHTSPVQSIEDAQAKQAIIGDDIFARHTSEH